MRSFEKGYYRFVDNLAGSRVAKLLQVCKTRFRSVRIVADKLTRDGERLAAAQPDHTDPAAAGWSCQCDDCIGHRTFSPPRTQRAQRYLIFLCALCVLGGNSPISISPGVSALVPRRRTRLRDLLPAGA